MSDDEFAAKLCLVLLRKGAFLEDSEPHRLIESTARELFPEVRRLIRAELEAALQTAGS